MTARHIVADHGTSVAGPSVGLPAAAGMSLKPAYYREVLGLDDRDLWVEVHPENYMVQGGPRLAWLEAIRAERPLSFHGVGASLGGDEPLDQDHLSWLTTLVDRFQPDSISEHATWSACNGHYLADLLPLPRTDEALAILCGHVEQFQEAIGRSILLENPSVYLPLAGDIPEPEFLAEAAKRTGCGLLLDVNNVYVSAHNVGYDPKRYLDAFDLDRVGEIHIAGHDADPNHGVALLIDTHAAPVRTGVWELLDYVLERAGPKPVLVERDAELPAFETMLAECRVADRRIALHRDRPDVRDAQGAARFARA
jgi:hypothetical protein